MAWDNDMLLLAVVWCYIIVALGVYMLRNHDEWERRKIPFWVLFLWPGAILVLVADWFTTTEYTDFKVGVIADPSDRLPDEIEK